MSQDMHDENLLDHEYDGIRELDNQLPRWWVYGFYFTIIFGMVYMLYWHGTDVGLSSAQEYEAELQEAFDVYGIDPEKGANDPVRIMAGMTLELRTDEASLSAGREIFNTSRGNCYTCHLEDLGGSIGPNLTDNYWIHGCDLESIVTNIITGFPEKGMIPYGSGNPLTEDELLQVASYVISMRGTTPAAPKPVDMERAVECE